MAQSFCSGCGRPAGAGHEAWCEVVRRGREEEEAAAARDRRLAVAVAIAAVGFFLLASIAKGQDVPLRVDGGRVVQVDRQVVVKVDVTVVDRLPFSVQAPPGAGLYFWSYPAGVTATDRGDRLEITGAAKGETTVGVKMITADVDAAGKFKGFVTKFGSVTFTVGDVPAPKPPDPKPEPEPTDPLYQPLKAAWLKEVDKAKRDTLAEVYALLSDEAKAPGIWLDARTVAEFSQRATAARKAAIGEALPLTRAVITAEMNKALPTQVSATMGQHRAAVAALYARIADLLRRLP